MLLLDKPAGLSSNTALQRAKCLFQAAKAGHTGNLDPLATGLLPVCFGEATKFAQYLTDADKHYEARVQLGVTTDTGDAEGTVLTRAPVAVTDAAVMAALARFVGAIQQTPPMYSALKHRGRPLYAYARQGEHVARAPRTITIHALELLGRSADQLLLSVHCSKGTYIRTLAEDIGKALGCGAHLAALRRTAVGPFRIEEAVTLDALSALDGARRDRWLMPVDCLLTGLPGVRLDVQSAFYLQRGQPVWLPRLSRGETYKIYDDKQRFIGVGQVDEEGRLAPRRLVAEMGQQSRAPDASHEKCL